MADMCADGPAPFEVGLLSKQTEAWVLVTLVRDGRSLRGLRLLHPRAHRWHAERAHRVGIDPAHLQRDSVLRAMMTEQYRRAVLGLPRRGRSWSGAASPAPVGSRRSSRSTTSCLVGATPPPVRNGPGSPPGQALRRRERRLRRPQLQRHRRTACSAGLDPRPQAEELAPTWSACSAPSTPLGRSLIAFGWAMAEQLAKLG